MDFLNTSRISSRLSPMHQALFGVFFVLVLQYAFNSLAYLGAFPEIYGKHINEVIKNTSYVIPGIVAVCFVLFFEGTAGLVRIFSPYTRVPSVAWWVFAAICLIIPLYLALFLDDLLYFAVVNEPWGRYDFTIPSWSSIALYTPTFVAVAVSDELFWIGFVYPRLLLAGVKPLKASLLIGLLWGVDYIPFLFTEFFLSPGLNAPNLIFGWFAVAPLYLWLYHMTKSALLIVFFNVCMQNQYGAVPVLPINSGDNSELSMANITVLIFGIWLWRFSSLSGQAGKCKLDDKSLPINA